MDKETIARATPLVETQIANQREHNKIGIVKSVLASEGDKSSITPEWVSNRVSSMYQIDLDDGTTEINANSILDSLESEGILDQKQNGEYNVIKEPEVGSMSDLIDPVWKEFKSQVESDNQDIDLHFVNDSLKDAFYGFFNNYFEFLIESSVELSEYETDKLYSSNIESIIDDTIDSFPLHDENLFRTELLEYLDEPSDALLNLVNEFYLTLVNVDLLSKEKKLDFDEIPGSDKKLLLDTNVIVALLCDTDNSNSLATSVCERSNEIGFNLVYTEDTKDEMRRLIYGSKREMEGFRAGDKEFDAVGTQFVHDYLTRDNVSWEEYIAEVSEWEKLAELNWGITQLEEEIETNTGVYEFAYDTFKQLEKVQEDEKIRESNENKINHDANILSITQSIRNKSEENIELGPYVLTLHNKMTTVSEIGKEDCWDGRIALQLRTWLNYLATFTPSDSSDANQKKVATAIIESSRSREQNIEDISEYARLVAPKAGLDSRQEDILAEYFVSHPLSREMEKALEDNRGDQAEQLAKEMLEDEERLKRFEELESQSEKLDQLRDSLSDVRQKWESEKEKREQLEEILESQNQININLTANATADASVKTDLQDLNEEINEFIQLLDTRLPDGYENSDLPQPPGSDATVEETEDWLRELKISIASSGTVSALEPYASELLDSLSSMM